MRSGPGRGLPLTLLVASAAQADSGCREVQTPHVLLRTDLSSRGAREAALTVERYRAEIIAAAWPRARLPTGERIELTVLSDGRDFERYFGRTVAGVFIHGLAPSPAVRRELEARLAPVPVALRPRAGHLAGLALMAGDSPARSPSRNCHYPLNGNQATEKKAVSLRARPRDRPQPS